MLLAQCLGARCRLGFLPWSIWNVPFICEDVKAQGCCITRPGTEPRGVGQSREPLCAHLTACPRRCPWMPVQWLPASPPPCCALYPHSPLPVLAAWPASVETHPENSSHVPPVGSLCWTPSLTPRPTQRQQSGSAHWGPCSPPTGLQCDTRQVTHTQEDWAAGGQGRSRNHWESYWLYF